MGYLYIYLYLYLHLYLYVCLHSYLLSYLLTEQVRVCYMYVAAGKRDDKLTTMTCDHHTCPPYTQCVVSSEGHVTCECPACLDEPYQPV